MIVDWDDFSIVSEKDIFECINAKIDLNDIFNFLKLSFEIQESSSGWTHKRCCPLPDHQDSTPSFGFNPKNNCWNCFGCHRGGGPIQFIATFYSFSNQDAADFLIKKFNILNISEDEIISYKPQFLLVKETLYNFAIYLQTFYRKSAENNDFEKFKILETLNFYLHLFLRVKFHSETLSQDLEIIINKLKQKLSKSD